MEQTNKKSGGMIAIVTMFALYAMCGFVTYLAAPAGAVWQEQPGINGSNALGMMGNMMNFLAYLLMGYPAGSLLQRIGYKKTALLATGSGAAGILIQIASGYLKLDNIAGIPAAWFVYLFGALVSGASNCLLNTVICPMLNQIVGGGKKGNQLNLAGSACNSVCAAAAPILLGSVVGQITKNTQFSDISGVLFAAAGVFVLATVIISMLPIANPTSRPTTGVVYERNALSFRHCLLGVIGIFLYMGIEAGIPTTMMQWLRAEAGPLGGGASAMQVATWMSGGVMIMMLIGRLTGAAIGGLVSPRTMLLTASGGALVLVIAGLMMQSVTIPFNVQVAEETGAVVAKTLQVPITAFCFVATGIFVSVMWGVIFNLSTEGLGKYTEQASGLFMMMVVGGGIIPFLQNWIADKWGFMWAYVVPAACLAYLFVYALAFTKNVNTDIKVD